MWSIIFIICLIIVSSESQEPGDIVTDRKVDDSLDSRTTELTETTRSTDFDPNLDICEKPQIDGAIVERMDSKDETYLLKGDYYWRTNKLIEKPGVIENAKKITDKWPEITHGFKSLFTIWFKNQSDVNLIPYTIFVVGRKWMAYRDGKQVSNGSTARWPEFPTNQIFVPVFPFRYSTEKLVLVLYDNNARTMLYEFTSPTNINRPELKWDGLTSISPEYYFVFMDEPIENMDNLIHNEFPIKASIQYSESYIFIANNNYCIFNPLGGNQDKKCIRAKNQTLSHLFGCPLNLSQTTHQYISTTEEILTSLSTSLSTSLNTSSSDHYSNANNSNQESVEQNITTIRSDAGKGVGSKTEAIPPFVWVVIVLVCFAGSIMLCICVIAIINRSDTKSLRESSIRSKVRSSQPISSEMGSTATGNTVQTINSITGEIVKSEVNQDSQHYQSFYKKNSNKGSRISAKSGTETTLSQNLKHKTSERTSNISRKTTNSKPPQSRSHKSKR